METVLILALAFLPLSHLILQFALASRKPSRIERLRNGDSALRNVTDYTGPRYTAHGREIG